MKKLFATLTAVALCASMLCACGNSSSASSAGSSSSSASSGSTASGADSASSETVAPDLAAVVASIETVNEVSNPREIDDFSLENEIGVTMDNVASFKGDVTNDQSDCSLVLAIEAKDGMADAIKSDLEAYKEQISSSLYAEFAEKVAKAQDSRIVVKNNVVVMVIAGVNGPDYAAIDAAIEQALA